MPTYTLTKGVLPMSSTTPAPSETAAQAAHAKKKEKLKKMLAANMAKDKQAASA